MNNIPSRYDWVFDGCSQFIRDNETGLLIKKELINYHIAEFMQIALQMFEWKGLPDTIPAIELERILLMKGLAGFFKYRDGVYAVAGGDDGEFDIYHRPTMLIVSNPRVREDGQGNYKLKNAIDLNVTYPTLKGDAVTIWNDSQRLGIWPVMEFYAGMLAEAEITLNFALYNNRVKALVEADTDDAKESWDLFFKHIVQGNSLGSVAGTLMSEAIKAWPFNQTASGAVKEALEAIQYFRAKFHNDIGLQDQFNMKRESINGQEAGLNEFSLRPKVDDMLRCRRDGVEWLKKTFKGFESVSVDFGVGWKLQKEHADAVVDMMQADADKNTDADSVGGEKTESGENTKTETSGEVKEDEKSNQGN